MSAGDPSSWPTWVQITLGVLAGSGPVGGLFGWMAKTYLKKEKAHHATRDAHEEVLRVMAVDFAGKLAARDEAHEAAAKRRDEEHHKQTAELTNRFVLLIETQSEAATKLLESIKRNRAGGKGE